MLEADETTPLGFRITLVDKLRADKTPLVVLVLLLVQIQVVLIVKKYRLIIFRMICFNWILVGEEIRPELRCR